MVKARTRVLGIIIRHLYFVQVEFGSDPTEYQPMPADYDEEYFVLKVGTSDPMKVDSESIFTDHQLDPLWTVKDLEKMGADEYKDTIWEHELKTMRMIR